MKNENQCDHTIGYHNDGFDMFLINSSDNCSETLIAEYPETYLKFNYCPACGKKLKDGEK